MMSKLSGQVAEETEAIYQGRRLDDEQRDGEVEGKKPGGYLLVPQPTYGLSIGDYTHRQFVAQLYVDTGDPS
jgi:hypothetical protein